MAPGEFEEHIASAFASATKIAQAEYRANSGIFAVHARAADLDVARDYLRAMLPAGPARAVLPLFVLSAADLDLRHLVPMQAELGRVHDGPRYWVLWFANTLQVFDRVDKRGLVWLAEGAAPSWELSRPAGPLLNQAARDTPCTLVHGAAVGRAGRTLLLVAPGRSGKTSAALACASAGWDYAGDDYVMVDSASGEVLPLFASARLREDMAARFPELIRDTRRAISQDDGEVRHELDLARVVDPARLRGGRMAALLVPRRRGAARVEFTPATPTDAFHALFAATVQGAPGALSGFAPKLAALVKRAPVYFVDSGPEPSAIPAAFQTFLDALDAGTTVLPG